MKEAPPKLCGIAGTKHRGGWRWQRGEFEATAAPSTLPADRAKKEVIWVWSWHYANYGEMHHTPAGLAGCLVAICASIARHNRDASTRARALSVLLREQ